MDVLCFGELLWDLYEAEQRGDKEPIARQFRRELGGTAANVAVALARLGIKAGVAGAVGADKLGAALDAQLSSDGVDTSNVVEVSGASTSVVFVMTSATGEPTFTPHRGADLQLTEKDITPAMGKAKVSVIS